jgi:hypothetical protein
LRIVSTEARGERRAAQGQKTENRTHHPWPERDGPGGPTRSQLNTGFVPAYVGNGSRVEGRGSRAKTPSPLASCLLPAIVQRQRPRTSSNRTSSRPRPVPRTRPNPDFNRAKLNLSQTHQPGCQRTNDTESEASSRRAKANTILSVALQLSTAPDPCFFRERRAPWFIAEPSNGSRDIVGTSRGKRLVAELYLLCAIDAVSTERPFRRR